MLLGCYEICVWDLDGFWAFKRFDEIFLWDLMILGRFWFYLWDFLLFAAYNYSHEICWEGARVVGCAWSLSVSSLPATVFGSEFFRLFFLRRLWMNSASFTYSGSCCTFCVRDFLMRLGALRALRDFMRFPFMIFPNEILSWDLIVRCHVFAALFSDDISCLFAAFFSR